MPDAKVDVKLVRVYASEIQALKEYVEALYRYEEDFDSMVYIEEGVTSLLKNENLATPYFIVRDQERLGYVILTRYHSVEKGGLTIYIDELYVEEKHRKGGIGGAILSEIKEEARNQGAKALWAQIEPFNKDAASFFKHQGFKVNPYVNLEMPL